MEVEKGCSQNEKCYGKEIEMLTKGEGMYTEWGLKCLPKR
jgi:hypothetical protein